MPIDRYYCFVLIAFCSFWSKGFVFSKKLPVYLRDLRCPMTKEFDSCFVVSANKAIPLIARGDPEFGIPKMTPLNIPFVPLISTPSLKVNLTNVEVYGLDTLRVKEHKIDLEKGSFSVLLKAENITVVGDYTADGNILVMRLTGKGRFSMFFKNGLYASTISSKIIEKNGEKYMKRTDSTFHAKFGQIIFHLDNFFEGNKQLGDQLNEFLNENWENLVADFGPTIAGTISKNINNLFDRYSAEVPVREVYV